MLTDLWLHLKRTWCLIRRKHAAEIYIGDFVKKGFRGVPLYQCPRCAEIVLRLPDAKRRGGKPA